MKKINASITAVGSFLPQTVLSNLDLEKIVDTNDEWITTRTGIKERRILDKGIGTSYMAINAAKAIIEEKKINPLEIDLVIVATITPDMHATATAAFVASKIGATNAFGFDINAACSGFLYGMSTASAFIESGRYKKILFGDGAGAVLIEPNSEGLGVQDEYLRSDGNNRDLLRIEAGGSQTPITVEAVNEKKHFIYQDGKNVFKHAVSNMADASEKIMTRNGLNNTDINFLVAHQANKRIIDATSNRMGIVDEKVLMNIHRYGNTTAATIPLILSDYESKFKKGDNIIFASFGAGFTWGAMFLKWAYNH